MDNYKVTFQNQENGKTKSFTVNAAGIIPAVEQAITKAVSKNIAYLSYVIISAEMMR